MDGSKWSWRQANNLFLCQYNWLENWKKKVWFLPKFYKIYWEAIWGTSVRKSGLNQVHTWFKKPSQSSSASGSITIQRIAIVHNLLARAFKTWVCPHTTEIPLWSTRCRIQWLVGKWMDARFNDKWVKLYHLNDDGDDDNNNNSNNSQTYNYKMRNNWQSKDTTKKRQSTSQNWASTIWQRCRRHKFIPGCISRHTCKAGEVITQGRDSLCGQSAALGFRFNTRRWIVGNQGETSDKRFKKWDSGLQNSVVFPTSVCSQLREDNTVAPRLFQDEQLSANAGSLRPLDQIHFWSSLVIYFLDNTSLHSSNQLFLRRQGIMPPASNKS